MSDGIRGQKSPSREASGWWNYLEGSCDTSEKKIRLRGTFVSEVKGGIMWANMENSSWERSGDVGGVSKSFILRTKDFQIPTM